MPAASSLVAASFTASALSGAPGLVDVGRRLPMSSAHAPELPLRAWRDAHAMIHEAGPLLPSAALISLDHDREPEPAERQRRTA